MYRDALTVRLAHTDAAGVIFFPRLFELAHEGWERFLEAAGSPIGAAMAGPGPMLPIVHCEADYRRPMRVGDKLDYRLALERLGTGSCSLRHRFLDGEGRELANALTVHAAMDRLSFGPVPLTPQLRELLERLGGEEDPSAV